MLCMYLCLPLLRLCAHLWFKAGDARVDSTAGSPPARVLRDGRERDRGATPGGGAGGQVRREPQKLLGGFEVWASSRLYWRGLGASPQCSFLRQSVSGAAVAKTAAGRNLATLVSHDGK